MRGMEQHPAWEGCRIEGDTLTTPEGHAITAGEIRHFHWLKGLWAAELRRRRRAVDEDYIKGFTFEEIRTLRAALDIISDRLPQMPQERRSAGRRG